MPGSVLGVRDMIISKTRVSALRINAGGEVVREARQLKHTHSGCRVEAGWDGDRTGRRMEARQEAVAFLTRDETRAAAVGTKQGEDLRIPEKYNQLGLVTGEDE